MNKLGVIEINLLVLILVKRCLEYLSHVIIKSNFRVC